MIHDIVLLVPLIIVIYINNICNKRKEISAGRLQMLCGFNKAIVRFYLHYDSAISVSMFLALLYSVVYACVLLGLSVLYYL